VNIYQRINEVRKQVAYIQKDKQVKGQGYMAVTHDAVTSALREHLIATGIVIVPSLVSSQVVLTGTTTSSGVPIVRLETQFDVAFVNMDDPQDKVVVRMESHALDQGDKAPGKATSYATKYAMLKLFSIETGEQEEERIPAKSKEKILTGAITPTEGAWDGIATERAEVLRRISQEIVEHCQNERWEEAYKAYYGNLDARKMDNDEALAVWADLKSYSAFRRKLKATRDERNTKEKAA
jgi:hypothetical protein